MATRVTAYHPSRGSVSFICDLDTGHYTGCGESGEQSVLGGNAKAGWKVDWALRWYAYEVDYEMYGKDLIDSVRQSSRIVRLMGKQPPVGLCYEFFLDEEGRGLASSAGRMGGDGGCVEEVRAYRIPAFLFVPKSQAGQAACTGISSPSALTTISMRCGSIPMWPKEKQPEQAVWHIGDRGAVVPQYASRVNFSTVNNLISALGVDSVAVLGDYLARYDAQASTYPQVTQALVEKGLNYYRDVVLPNKHFSSALGRGAGAPRAVGRAAERDQRGHRGGIAVHSVRFGPRGRSFPQVAVSDVLRSGAGAGARAAVWGRLCSLVGREQVVKMVREKAVAHTGTFARIARVQ